MLLKIDKLPIKFDVNGNDIPDKKMIKAPIENIGKNELIPEALLGTLYLKKCAMKNNPHTVMP